jgi:hypothetical protein
LDDAVKKEHFFRQSEIELELGELLRDDKPEEASEFYESALDSAKKANHMENVVLAYRNLGELHIDSAETEGKQMNYYFIQSLF